MRRVYNVVCFCFRLGYDHNLLGGFPNMGVNRCSPALDMVVYGLGFSYGLRPWALGGTENHPRHYRRPTKIYAIGGKGTKETSNYQRSWKTTLYGILASQGFGLMFGAAFFGYVVTSQPPSIYPVFGYGKPPPILIEGFSSYHWAIVGAVIGFIFVFLALRSRKASSLATQKQK